MAELIEKLPRSENIRVIYSPYYGHANLSADMIEKLQATRQI
jgi:hypothetical protein